MHCRQLALASALLAGAIIWFVSAAWALPPRCRDFPYTACPAEQGCTWEREEGVPVRHMCKTFCGTVDPCSGTAYACCSWEWSLYLKHGEDCTTPPIECWAVSDSDEVSGPRCATIGGDPYPCCEQHDATCQYGL